MRDSATAGFGRNVLKEFSWNGDIGVVVGRHGLAPLTVMSMCARRAAVPVPASTRWSQVGKPHPVSPAEVDLDGAQSDLFLPQRMARDDLPKYLWSCIGDPSATQNLTLVGGLLCS